MLMLTLGTSVESEELGVREAAVPSSCAAFQAITCCLSQHKILPQNKHQALSWLPGKS